jgi:molybdopterin synthase sulfur carrier subunit
MGEGMMRVRFFGTLRHFAGAKELDVNLESGDTVRSMLHQISTEHTTLGAKMLDGEGKLQSAINVLVNGRSITFLDGLDTVLHEGDRIALFPAVGGG